MAVIIRIFSKFFFLSSAVVFLMAMLFADSWLPELAASMSVFHTLSSIVFIAVFYFLGLKRWTFGAGILISAQILILSATYFNSEPLKQAGSDEVLTFVQYNTHYINRASKNVVDWLEANHSRFDIIFLQEVNIDLIRELERLNKYYPHRIIKPDEQWLGRAFFSKIPILSHKIEYFDYSPIHYLVVEVKTMQDKHIKFYGLHATAPISPGYIDKRNHQLDEVARLLSRDDSSHVIVAGDLNTCPYSTAFRKFMKSTGFKRPRVHCGTWPTSLPVAALRLQIDHCLVSHNIDFLSQEIGPDNGSDHLPLVTSIVLRNSSIRAS